MSNAAIKAVYTDYRRVKSRKVIQVVFEVPMETWPNDYRVLGEPAIETSQWFAIAKMAASEPAPTPASQGTNLSANAALTLKEPAFWRFMRVNDEEWAEYTMKSRLGIQSKSELNTDPAAAARWRDLRAEFEAWKRT